MRWWTGPRTPSLALRLAAGFAAAFLAVAAVYAGLQLVLAQRFGSFVTRMSMAGQTEDFFEGLRFDAAGRVVGVTLERAEAYGFDAFHANLKYRVLDAEGRVVASSDAGGASLLPDLPVGRQSGFFGVVRLDGVDFHVGAWQREVDGRSWVVQLGRSDRFEELAREAISPAITETVGLLAALSALVFSIAAVLAVRSVLRPIARAIDAASRVGRDNLAVRLPDADMPGEIRPLLRSFNGVLDRLQAAFDEQQRFIANAAHELKTPLAMIRAQLETGEAADRELIRAEVDAMSRRVHQLLQLAETADAGNLRRGRSATCPGRPSAARSRCASTGRPPTSCARPTRARSSCSRRTCWRTRSSSRRPAARCRCRCTPTGSPSTTRGPACPRPIASASSSASGGLRSSAARERGWGSRCAGRSRRATAGASRAARRPGAGRASR
jgi:hypothetical protein